MGTRHVDDRSLASAGHHSRLRFLELPGEQRNQTYRHLFDDITILNGSFETWERALPRYGGKLAAFSALTMTCRAIYQEASTIFRAEYLPKMTIYFDDFHTFIGMCGPDLKEGLKASRARFVLRTPNLQNDSNGFGIAIMQLLVGPEFSSSLIEAELRSSVNSRIISLLARTSWGVSKTANGGSSIRIQLNDGILRGATEYPRILPKYPRLRVLSRIPIPEQDAIQLTETIEGRFCDLTWRGWEARGAEQVGALADLWTLKHARVLDNSWFEGEGGPM